LVSKHVVLLFLKKKRALKLYSGKSFKSHGKHDYWRKTDSALYNDNASGTFKGPMKVFKIKRSFISFYCIYKGRN